MNRAPAWRKLLPAAALPLFAAALLYACSDNPAGPSDENPTYLAGETYFGAKNYIEYIAGDLPIVLGAPHGGYERPSSIPDRSGEGISTGRDLNTQELAREIALEFHRRTGRHLHVVICRLARIKLDANRDVGEAALGNPEAIRAWEDWHRFIDAARDTIVARFGAGLYIDLHGHGHDLQRLELGYLLTSSELELSDQQMIDVGLATESSISALSAIASVTFPELLRGESSLGSLLTARSFASVPSSWAPDPGGNPYFTGGYNTLRHGSREGGSISSVQIECNYTGVRDSEANREEFATALASALEAYFIAHFGFTVTGEPVPQALSTEAAGAVPPPFW
ncbi:hypothetical protein ACFL4Y_02100 [Gemmatimonadota bacterium]